jgi:TolB-like protein/Flp pilus assembly protein TadD
MSSTPANWGFGSVQVMPGDRSVRVNGVTHKPGARAFDLLLLLVENRHRVVGKAEIFERVWPGVVVEENNLTVQVSALRKILGPDVLATFSGRGYRFMLDLPAATEPLNQSSRALALPAKPSIAVLPFLHLAGDATREYLTDGITEDITTELSRFRSLFVISRQSSFTYKGKPVDVPNVGRELGVRYVVEGSVRLSGRHLRVTAQLIDAVNGAHVWAEKYDGAIEELFNIQDEIVGQISVAVAQGVERHEFHTLRSRPADWGAYEIAVEAYQLGSDAFNRSDRDMRERALARANDALALDPDSAMGLHAKLLVLWQTLFFATAQDRAGTLKEAFATLDRWETLDAGNAKVYTFRGLLQHEAGQTAAGIVSLQKSHEMNPNDTGALGGLGVLEMLAGLSESAVEHFLLARRLNPLDPWAWSPNTGLGNAYVGLREFDKALHYGQLGASEAPHVVTTHLVIATAQVGLGNLAQARDAMKRAVQVGPEFIQRRFETLESGLSINDTMRFRIGLMLTAVRLLDKAQLPAPLRDMLDRLEAAGI